MSSDAARSRAALRCRAARPKREEKMAVVAGERLVRRWPMRVPQKAVVVGRGVDHGPAMAVGAGIAAVVVGVAEDTENVRPNSSPWRTVPKPSLGPMEWRNGWSVTDVSEHPCMETISSTGERPLVEALPIDAARAEPVADVMREGHGAVAPGAAAPRVATRGKLGCRKDQVARIRDRDRGSCSRRARRNGSRSPGTP